MLVYVSRCVALLFFQHRRCMWVVNTTLQPHKPGNGPAPIVLRVGGTQGRSGRVQKFSLPPGFDLLNVHPLVRQRYPDKP